MVHELRRLHLQVLLLHMIWTYITTDSMGKHFTTYATGVCATLYSLGYGIRRSFGSWRFDNLVPNAGGVPVQKLTDARAGV